MLNVPSSSPALLTGAKSLHPMDDVTAPTPPLQMVGSWALQVCLLSSTKAVQLGWCGEWNEIARKLSGGAESPRFGIHAADLEPVVAVKLSQYEAVTTLWQSSAATVDSCKGIPMYLHSCGHKSISKRQKFQNGRRLFSPPTARFSNWAGAAAILSSSL